MQHGYPDARPAHVPEATWVQCDERVAQARGARGDDVPTIPVDPSLIEDHSSAGQVALAVAPAAALILAMAGSQVSQAIAPDEETADAWSWNHTMRSCLEDRGIRLP